MGIWGVRDGVGVSVGVAVQVGVGDHVGEGVADCAVRLAVTVGAATVGRGLGVLDGVGDMITVGLAIATTSVGVGLPAHDANMLNMSSKPQASSPLDEGFIAERQDL